jgi:hypothetical protein
MLRQSGSQEGFRIFREDFGHPVCGVMESLPGRFAYPRTVAAPRPWWASYSGTTAGLASSRWSPYLLRPSSALRNAS